MEQHDAKIAGFGENLILVIENQPSPMLLQIKPRLFIASIENTYDHQLPRWIVNRFRKRRE